MGSDGLRLFRELRARAAHVAHSGLRTAKREAALLLCLCGARQRRPAIRVRQTLWSSAARAKGESQQNTRRLRRWRSEREPDRNGALVGNPVQSVGGVRDGARDYVNGLLRRADVVGYQA